MADETVTQQIVREAPEIEAYKLKLLQEAQNLAFNVGQTPLSQQLPAYQVSDFSPAQLAAIQATEQQGIGAFTPYMQAANQALGSAYATTGEAADILRGADTRKQFADAQLAMQQAGGAAAGITQGLAPIGQGLGYLDVAGQRALMSDTTGRFVPAYQDIRTGLGALATGQNLAALSSQADLAPATAAIGQGLGGLSQAQQMALRTGYQPGFGAANMALGQGLQSLAGAQQAYDPGSVQAFMNPYQQQVIDETIRQINRQGQIAQQGLAAQAVRTGAFGGTREGVQRAELERNLAEQRNSTIANLLSQGYSQAQAQSMAAFEQQQARQMQAGQGIGQIGSQAAQVAAQQAGVGQAATGLYGNLAQQQIAAGQGLGQLGIQQAQLGQGAAGLYNQAAQQYGNLASQQGP